MTSVQERLQLKRMALDNWSTREKLCLATAVSCSGDQNWMSVSRSLKMLCGANRPADWFSQKSCAVQYGELLENVETPKRKKRTISERDNSITETPTESVLRRLTQERLVELKAQIKKDQEEYAKLREEILLVQSSNVTDGQLREMLTQIEQEQELKYAEQQKYAQWLKEREERKSELQKSWRPGAFPTGQIQQQGQKSVSIGINQKQEEMDIDETNVKHGTAPLLTSLLKSPSPAPSSTSSAVHPTVAAATSVRIAAPTITNLLTGNSTTQIASISTTTNTNQQQYHLIHSQPLTGPIPVDHHQQVNPSPSQAAPTLSMLLENKNKDDQGNQPLIATDEAKVELPEPMETEDGDSSSNNKDDDQQLMEVFNRLIPDNIIIDELEDILTNNNAIILNPELLEEESILEDVESLMDEQDEANDNKAPPTTNTEDVLQQKQQFENTESKNLPDSSDSTKVKEEIIEENATSLDPVNIPQIEDSSGGGADAEIETKPTDEPIKEAVQPSEEDTVPTEKQSPEKKEENVAVTVEKIDSSDDSSDNTTLQTLKNKIHVDDKPDESSDGKESPVEDILMEITTAVPTEEIFETSGNDIETSGTENADFTEIVLAEIKAEELIAETKKSSSESSDVIIITDQDSDSNEPATITEEEHNEITPRKTESPNKISKQQTFENNESSDRQSPFKQIPMIDKSITSESTELPLEQIEIKVELINTITMPEPTATITIIDTDEESPTEVIKEEKVNKNKRDYSRTKKSEAHADKKSDESGPIEESKQNLSIRKLKERDGSESPLVDDDNSDAIPRTRRRYSSTPIIDSIPSSPASSDDREYKAWKKSILMVYNRIVIHRHASIFHRPVTEEMAPNYKTIVFRPMDLHTIKKNIDNGVIRTTMEFQRDVMLMCQNAIIYNKKSNNVYNMAKEMMSESVAVIDSLFESVKRDSERIHSGSAVKWRSRKSHRLP